MADRQVLNVGIDLGTSRSVIACDNGIRTYLPSIVGYPKDAVSQKMFGKEIIYGDEALQNRLSLDLYRPFAKGMLKFAEKEEYTRDAKLYEKSRQAAMDLMQQLISMATVDEPEDITVRGVIGAPALASLNNKKELLDVSSAVLDDAMIASEPFAVAYGLNVLSKAFIIDIGAGTVDLCRMHGTIPTEEDQITTFKAGDYVDEIFLNLIKKKYSDANFTVSMIKRFKEENSFISQHGERVTIDLPVEGKPTKHDVTDELREACRSIVPEIVEGIKKLIAAFDPEFQDELKRNVILAGGGSQIVGLRKEIEDYMKKNLGFGRVIKAEEPLYAGANGALMLCKDMPDEYWDKLKSDQDKAS
jgi:rod shape-determining protein MreB